MKHIQTEKNNAIKLRPIKLTRRHGANSTSLQSTLQLDSCLSRIQWLH